MSRARGVVAGCLAATLLATGAFIEPAPVRAGGDSAPPGRTQLAGGTGETIEYLDQTGTLVRAVRDGWDLDVYSYSDSNPLSFAIDITRSYGPVDTNGHPIAGNPLFGKTGKLTLRH